MSFQHFFRGTYMSKTQRAPASVYRNWYNRFHRHCVDLGFTPAHGWWYRMSCSVRFFWEPFFLDALYIFESLKCMHIYLNLVKINCFLDIFKIISSKYNLQMYLVAPNFGIDVFCAYNKSYLMNK